MVIEAVVHDEYRRAFENFSRKARRVQLLTESPNSDPETVEAALIELETAHMAYNDARDAMMRELLPVSTSSGHELDDYRGDVSAIAELLWESAGRPSGTAEQDWRRAEAILERAVATTCGA